MTTTTTPLGTFTFRDGIWYFQPAQPQAKATK